MKVNCDIPVLMSDNEKIINSDEFSVQIIIFMSAGSIISLKMRLSNDGLQISVDGVTNSTESILHKFC